MTCTPAADAIPPRWHRALALALLGEDRDDLDEPARPDVAAVIAALGGIDGVAVHARQVRDAEQPWPHPLPSALTVGMGPAQLQALLTAAVEHVRTVQRATAPVIRQGSLTADEMRLLRDVPPHHGV